MIEKLCPRAPGRLLSRGLLAVLLVLAGAVFAQSPSPLPAPETLPPIVVLTPQEALRSFQLESGFQIELVVHEPMVKNPIAMDIDGDGRMWIVEMPSYMRDAAGSTNQEPTGRIVVLEDRDGDGTVESRQVFLDGLVLPRAVKAVQGGALVGEPPNLWFCPDADGDGKADRKILLRNDYSLRESHPNYGPNGLLWARDNWITSAVYPVRLRRAAGSSSEWISEPDIDRGQWGLAQDDEGRLYWNSNRDQLFSDFIPGHYYTRNAHSRAWAGFAINLMREDQRVWPNHETLGVSLVDTPGTLRPDRTLASFTSACGPVRYRGDAFPAEYRGNAFLCEPAANIIRRLLLKEHGSSVQASLPYEGREFLASTDERFRPVNLYNAPDGCLYVVDMYKGIIEYKQQIGPRLRRYIESRKLDGPQEELGRIYRIRATTKPRTDRPKLIQASTKELIQALAHPAGWWRDMAQQVLVDRGDASVIPDLRTYALAGRPAGELGTWGAIHAIWSLEGLSGLDGATVDKLLADRDPRLRLHAVRASDRALRAGTIPDLLPKIAGLSRDPDPSVRVQVAFTLGESADPAARETLYKMLEESVGHRELCDAVVSSLKDHEHDALVRLLHSEKWQQEQSNLERTLRILASCVFEERHPQRLHDLLELAGGDGTAPQEWQRLALLEGIAGPLPWVTNLPLVLSGPPEKFLAMRDDARTDVKRKVRQVERALTWPGKGAGTTVSPPPPLAGEDQASYQRGEPFYMTTCAVCHGMDGRGRKKTAPPLSGSPWVRGPAEVPVKILLHGLTGPLEVNGESFSSQMPPMAFFDDQQVADILTYVRRAWGNDGAPVPKAEVVRIREATKDRKTPWLTSDLLK